MQNNEETKWYGWVGLFVVIGLVVWGVWPEQKTQMTPAEIKQTFKESDEFETRKAKQKCADQEDQKLFNACVETERERISDEYDERARESLGR
jgi:hypothetical protein